MGIRDDFGKTSEFWNEGSFWLKSSIIFSQLLAVSAIASLSELIVEWRGFFADGIAFYNIYVSDPLRRLLSGVLRLDLSVTQLNVLIFSSLWYAGVIRAQKYDAPDMFALTDRVLPLAISIFFVIFFWQHGAEPRVGAVVGVVLIMLFGVVGALQRPGIARLAYFGPLILSMTIVVVLGAISIGVTAPLPSR